MSWSIAIFFATALAVLGWSGSIFASSQSAVHTQNVKGLASQKESRAYASPCEMAEASAKAPQIAATHPSRRLCLWRYMRRHGHALELVQHCSMPHMMPKRRLAKAHDRRRCHRERRSASHKSTGSGCVIARNEAPSAAVQRCLQWRSQIGWSSAWSQAACNRAGASSRRFRNPEAEHCARAGVPPQPPLQQNAQAGRTAIRHGKHQTQRQINLLDDLRPQRQDAELSVRTASQAAQDTTQPLATL
jgi:hypothetical protein